MKTGYVYILECSDYSFNTGVTNDIERRLAEHVEGKGGIYVSSRKPFQMVWLSDELDIQEAILLEKRIKGWRREKKFALTNEQYEKLPELSISYYKRE